MKYCKKIISFLMILLFVAVSFPVSADTPIRVFLYGNELSFDVPPQIIHSRTMVPLRAIFEALGATVNWNQTTQTVTSARNDVTIRLRINQNVMYVNGTEVPLDSPACLVDGRTLVPVRAISEAFGISVEWFGEEQIVTLGNTDGVSKNSLFQNGLARVMKDGKYGYVNQSGEEVIPLRFDYAMEFHNGSALVKSDDRWHSIDTAGNIGNTLTEVSAVSSFSEGFATVQQNGKWGYANSKGEVVITPQFDIVRDFHEGLAEVASKRTAFVLRFGYITTRGTLQIAPQFEETDRFCEGLAAVKENGKWTYLKPNGNKILVPTFEDCSRFSNGLAAVKQNGKWGYINQNGKMVIAPQFDDAYEFSDGLATVFLNESYYFINKNGDFITSVGFQETGDFSDGLAPVTTEDFSQSAPKWGYLTKDGNIKIPLQFEAARNFSNGLAAVQINGKWGFIDTDGEWAISPQFEGVMQDFSDDGYAVCRDENFKEFIIDKNGTILTEAYDDIPTKTTN